MNKNTFKNNRLKIASYSLLAIFAASNAWSFDCGVDLCTKITGLLDLDLGDYSGTGDLVGSYGLCVYTVNDDESNYDAKGSGTGPASAYVATNGTDSISILAEFDETAGPYQTLTALTSVTVANPNVTEEDCAVGGDSAKVRVTMAEAALQASTAGTYNETIQIIISPD